MGSGTVDTPTASSSEETDDSLSRKRNSKLSFEDPFDAEEAQADTAAPSVTVTKDKPAQAESDGKVVLTFKGGRDFDAPWIVIHANGLQEAHDFVVGDNASLLATVMDRVKVASQHFAGKPAAAPAAAPQRQAPQAATEAPGGEKRFCEHGEMVFKSGVAKATGKPYKLFSCTAPREQQCKAQFL